MARIRIPLSSEIPHFSVKADLDGVPFALGFHWGRRFGRWTISLLDELEGQVFSGARPLTAIGRWMDQAVLLTLSVPRFRRIYDLTGGKLPGLLYASTPAPLAGTQEDLDQVSLVYVDGAEMAPFLVTA